MEEWVEEREDIPVEAVIATTSGDLTCFFRRVFMISRRRTDFPVPVDDTISSVQEKATICAYINSE